MEFTLGTVTKLVLVMVLAVVLLLVFVNPLKGVYDSLNSLGSKESTDLAYSKEDCNKQIDAGKIDDCALYVAELSLSEGEAPIIAESWLRKQIEMTKNNEYLTRCFEFARDKLYPESKDWKSAIETYNLIKQKDSSIDVKDAVTKATANDKVSDATKIYDKIRLSAGLKASGQNILTDEIVDILYFLKDAVKIYQTNQQIGDTIVFGDCSGFFNSMKELNYYGKSSYDVVIACSIGRESLKTGCYYSNSECVSCTNYQPKTEDPCSGYSEGKSCETNPCTESVCRWQIGGPCKTGTYDVFGQTNMWDLR